MQINNPLQMNDWEISNFLKAILTVQLALLGIIGLDTIDIQVPIIRQLIGFIYIIFIPGIIILRILKLHKLGNIETILYAVGLSITTLMFTGLFMNMIYPFFSISKPISITPLMITISMLILILCILSYVRDKDFSDPSFIDVGDMLSPPILFLCLIPFLSIFGTYLVNFHQNNIILMVLIVIIALMVILVAFDMFIPKNLYPLVVFIIAISLLYHRSLISIYLTGSDIHTEYYFANLVRIVGRWNPMIYSNVNAMLSIVMLAPIFSNICNMNLTWVFKIIYPLLFSLVPLGLYQVFRKQTDDKIAFLSCFFFMSVFTFYTEMLQLARQEIAELFLVLLILLLIDKDMNQMKRKVLFIIFAFSLAVSHYGISYIFMLLLIVTCDLFFLNTWRKNQNNEIKIITYAFILLYITFATAWYIYVSSSSAFDSIVHIGVHITGSIFTQFMDPVAAQGLATIMMETASPLHDITKYLHLLTQFFIAVGILTLMLKHNKMKFEKEYAIFSYVNFGICLVGIAIPFFANALNTTRLYQITLIFLAPFCAIGAVTVFSVMSSILKISSVSRYTNSSLKVLSLFLMIFFLFNTGFVYEVAKDYPGSISISQNWIKNCKYEGMITAFYADCFQEQDIFGVKWISKNRDDELRVYADITHYKKPFVSYGMMLDDRYILTNVTKVRDGSYIYMGYSNVRHGLMCSSLQTGVCWWNATDILPLLNETSLIYSNGGAQVYY